MPKVTRSISFPQEILKRIDEIAKNEWYTDRSAAVTRIFQEWEQFRLEQATATKRDHRIPFNQDQLSEAA